MEIGASQAACAAFCALPKPRLSIWRKQSSRLPIIAQMTAVSALTASLVG